MDTLDISAGSGNGNGFRNSSVYPIDHDDLTHSPSSPSVDSSFDSSFLPLDHSQDRPGPVSSAADLHNCLLLHQKRHAQYPSPSFASALCSSIGISRSDPTSSMPPRPAVGSANLARNPPLLHGATGTQLGLTFTIVRSFPLWDVIAILILLLQLPPAVLSLVHFLFTALTFVPPVTSAVSTALPSLDDLFQSAGGSPSLGTILSTDLVVLVLWLVVCVPVQNLFLDLGQAVIAITLGGAAVSGHSTSNSVMVCSFVIIFSHFFRSKPARQYASSILFSALGKEPFPSGIPADILPLSLSQSRGWLEGLLGVHIVTQGLVRIVRRFIYHLSLVEAAAAVASNENTNKPSQYLQSASSQGTNPSLSDTASNTSAQPSQSIPTRLLCGLLKAGNLFSAVLLADGYSHQTDPASSRRASDADLAPGEGLDTPTLNEFAKSKKNKLKQIDVPATKNITSVPPFPLPKSFDEPVTISTGPKVPTTKMKKRQATWARSNQPLWSAIANAKVHAYKRSREHDLLEADAAEHLNVVVSNAISEGKADEISTDVELSHPWCGEAGEADIVWISDIKSTSVGFVGYIGLSVPLDGDDHASPDDTSSEEESFRPFTVRVNGADWSAVTSSKKANTVDGRDRTVEVWTGEIRGLTPRSSYLCEFLRTSDNALIASTILVTSFSSVDSVSPAPTTQSLRPLSPVATLKNSIAAAEQKLADARALLKRNRKEHSKTLSSLRREVDSLRSRLTTEFGDDKNSNRLNQLRQSARMAEESSELIIQQIESISKAVEKQRQATNQSRQNYLAAAKRRDVAKEKISLTKQESAKRGKDVAASLNSVNQKRDRLTTRNIKLGDQLEKIKQEGRQEQEKRVRREDMLRQMESTEQDLLAAVDKSERGCADITERLTNVLSRLDSVSRTAPATTDSHATHMETISPNMGILEPSVPSNFTFPVLQASAFAKAGSGGVHTQDENALPAASNLASLIDSSSPIDGGTGYDSPGRTNINGLGSVGYNHPNPIGHMSHGRAPSAFGTVSGTGAAGFHRSYFSRANNSSDGSFGPIGSATTTVSSGLGTYSPPPPVYHHHGPPGFHHAHNNYGNNGHGQNLLSGVDRTGSPAYHNPSPLGSGFIDSSSSSVAGGGAGGTGNGTGNTGPGVVGERRYGSPFQMAVGHLNRTSSGSGGRRVGESSFGAIGSNTTTVQHGGSGLSGSPVPNSGPPSGRTSRAGTIAQAAATAVGSGVSSNGVGVNGFHGPPVTASSGAAGFGSRKDFHLYQ